MRLTTQMGERYVIGGDRLLTVPEVAAWLLVHPESVRRWIRYGRLHGVLFGGTRAGYRVAQSEVERFIASGGESPAGDQPVSSER